MPTYRLLHFPGDFPLQAVVAACVFDLFPLPDDGYAASRLLGLLWCRWRHCCLIVKEMALERAENSVPAADLVSPYLWSPDAAAK